MDLLIHFTLPIFLGVKNYVAWLSKMKYAIANLDTDHLIIIIAMFSEDKKLQKKAVGLLIFEMEDDLLMVINSIDTLKGIFDKF